MRSRYTAYATSSTAHLMATTHPMSPHFESDRSAWQRSLLEFCTRTDFLGLTVHSARQDAARGWVHFTAHLRQAGQGDPDDRVQRVLAGGRSLDVCPGNQPPVTR